MSQVNVTSEELHRGKLFVEHGSECSDRKSAYTCSDSKKELWLFPCGELVDQFATVRSAQLRRAQSSPEVALPWRTCSVAQGILESACHMMPFSIVNDMCYAGFTAVSGTSRVGHG